MLATIASIIAIVFFAVFVVMILAGLCIACQIILAHKENKVIAGLLGTGLAGLLLMACVWLQK